ncbi:hypothetical protein D3C76_950530 [compost metagenome]
MSLARFGAFTSSSLVCSGHAAGASSWGAVVTKTWLLVRIEFGQRGDQWEKTYVSTRDG